VNYENMMNTAQGLELMKGLTFVKVEGAVGSDEMLFETAEGARFVFGHYQNCCERVDINDITGDLEDLVGEPLLIAEEVSGETPVDFDEAYHESVSWTFYKFATRKGYVDVRWLGESNGYYSESVDLFVEGVTVAEKPQPSRRLSQLLQGKIG